ncbi:MAG: helix-turn-helix domain-containing protein [Methylophilaceae bacterium]
MKATKSPPTPKQPDDAFAAVLSMRRLADKLEQKAVVEALKQGWTWAKIAEALNISKQAAHKRHAAFVKLKQQKSV